MREREHKHSTEWPIACAEIVGYVTILNSTLPKTWTVLAESLAAVPVRDNDGRIIAVLEVINRMKDSDPHKLRKDGFDENDVHKLGLVAAAVTCALDSCAVMERRWDAEFELRGIVDSCESAQVRKRESESWALEHNWLDLETVLNSKH